MTATTLHPHLDAGLNRPAASVDDAFDDDITIRDVSGRADLALVYLLQLGADPGRLVETVDSIDPRFAREEKSVIIISTQLGCPVGCLMCDAGGRFVGDLTADEMLAQVRLVIARRPAVLRARKLKVHFARMGEPSLNPHVIEALERLVRTSAGVGGLLPCVASVAPAGTEPFFDQLTAVRQRTYADHAFQLQLSINTTDPLLRRRLMPVELMSLRRLAGIGERFFRPGDRKVVLNFALARGLPVDVSVLQRTFDPERFMIKLTPVNPTDRALENGLDSVLDAGSPEAAAALVSQLHGAGFDVIVSIGEPDEIAIGSNCGQMVRRAAAAAARAAQVQPIAARR